jgi:UDP-glucose 4-epimerase
MELKSKKVAVTGGCGFIGSHIVEKLAGLDNEIVIIDNLSSGRAENIEGMEGNITHHNVSVTEDLSTYLEGTDIIFHLAANVFVGKSVEDPQFDADNNVMGMLNVLESARKLDIPKIIYSSSSAIYGDEVALPTDERQPISPSSPYGVSKYTGEMYLRTYHSLHGIESTSLRYFNVYGPRQADDSPYSGVIAIFIRSALRGDPLRIYGDGEQSRDFVSVKDVVDVNISAALQTGSKGTAYNIGTGRSYTLNQLAEMIETHSGKLERKFEPPRIGDIKKSVADISLAQKELNFKPTVELADGLKELYEAYRAGEA